MLNFTASVRTFGRLDNIWKDCEETNKKEEKKKEDADVYDAFDPLQDLPIFLKGWILSHAALTDPAAQFTVNLQTLRGW